MNQRRKLSYLIIILLVVMLLFSSCVSKVEKDNTKYLQALGEDGAFVITSSMSSLKEMNIDIPVDEKVLNKIDRISISIKDGEYYGGLEGHFSSFLVNSVLLVAKDYRKEGNYYENSDGSLQLKSPKNDLLLISSTNFDEARKKTVDNRIINIDSTTAALMENSDLAVYSNHTTSLKQLGYNIDDSVAISMNYLLIYYKDNLCYLKANFNSEKAANTFSIAMKASYITDLKKKRETIDITALKQIFLLNSSTMEINGLKMSQENVDDLNKIIENFI